jgi:hypothetical protein
MRGIGGVGFFGIFSICLFFAFFIGMAFWAVRLKQTYLNSMSTLPLDHEPALESKTERSPENCHE